MHGFEHQGRPAATTRHAGISRSRYYQALSLLIDYHALLIELRSPQLRAGTHRRLLAREQVLLQRLLDLTQT
jgi:hypothetical protein